MNLLKIFAPLAASAIAVTPLAAVANYAAVHKWVDSASGKTYVYVPGGTNGSPIPGFTSPKAPKSKVLTLNNCGWSNFTKSATSPPTMITGANWPPTNGSAPTCTKVAAPGTGYTDSNPAATGTIIDDSSKLWIKGGTAAGSITVNIETSGSITTKANKCNWLRVTVSDSRPMTTFNIGATQYTLDAIPAVTAPMICRKINDTTSATYVPAN